MAKEYLAPPNLSKASSIYYSEYKSFVIMLSFLYSLATLNLCRFFLTNKKGLDHGNFNGLTFPL